MDIQEKLVERVLRDVSFRLPCGGAFLDFTNQLHLSLIEESLRGFGVNPSEIGVITQELQTPDKKEPTKAKMSDEDATLLQQLGLDMRTEDIKKSVDLTAVNEKQTTFDTGGGHRVFQPKKIGYHQLEGFIETQEICYVTTAKTVGKLRSENNIRVVQWGRSRGPGQGFFDQIISIYKLIKEFQDKIVVSSKTPAGQNYELNRAEEINKVLESSVDPFRLFVEKDGVVKDMGVSIKKAQKVLGVGKADIALLDNHNTEVFWISYKHGDFFGKEGEIAEYVPFQQYGSLQNLYDRSLESEEDIATTDDIAGEDIKKIIDHFIHSILKKSDMTKYSMYDVEEVTGTPDGGYEIHKENGKTMLVEEGHPLFPVFDDLEVYRKLVKFLNKGPGNIHFYLQGTKEYYFNFLKSKLLEPKSLKTIAGKSVYGLDFYIGNTNFGRENVNILLQTSRTLMVSQHKQAKNTDYEDVDGITIKTDEMGHILFNPNLPDEDVKKAFQVIDQYTPVLYVRFTKKEVFRWTNENGRNIILGGRCMILPKGKKTTRSEEIK